MGKSVFTRIFSIFVFCTVLFANGVVFARQCQDGWYKGTDRCYKCPSGFDHTDESASREAQCYYIDSSGTHHSYVSCGTGMYYAKGYGCKKCKAGYFCPGVVPTKENKDQGIEQCPGSYELSDEKSSSWTDCYNKFLGIRNYYGCSAGNYFDKSLHKCQSCPSPHIKSEKNQAGRKEDCYYILNNGNNTKIFYGAALCSAGQYKKKDSQTCTKCPDGYLCPGGRFSFSDTKDQGIYMCHEGKKPSDDKKTCVVDDGAPSGGNGGNGNSGGGNSGNEGGDDRLCQDGYYKDSAAGCIKCQGGFSHSDSDATTKFKCWDYDTKNRKMYYGYIDGTGTEANPKTCDSMTGCTKCPDNTYVKAKTNWCSACPSGKVCMGGWYFPNMGADVGLNTVDSHGCRSGTVQGNTIINEQYYDGNSCKDCPIDAGFIQSDLNATSRDQCYKQVGNKKIYYKQVSCGAGQYLPKASSDCKTCLDGYYCTADKYYPNLKDDQGLKTCPNGQVPNQNKTACTDGASGSGIAKCDTGQYLPKNQGRCATCPSEKKRCPGGNYQYPKSEDQGVYDCPKNGVAKSDHSGCVFKLSQSILKHGPNGAKTKLAEQCWAQNNVKSYARCMFPNGLTSSGTPQPSIQDDATQYTATETHQDEK